MDRKILIETLVFAIFSPVTRMKVGENFQLAGPFIIRSISFFLLSISHRRAYRSLLRSRFHPNTPGSTAIRAVTVSVLSSLVIFPMLNDIFEAIDTYGNERVEKIGCVCGDETHMCPGISYILSMRQFNYSSIVLDIRATVFDTYIKSNRSTRVIGMK